MKRILIPAFAAAALALAGCETATPYQPINAPGSQASGGYSDRQIDASHWRVSFAGNSLTSRDTVERYLLYRAAELTLQRGGEWFSAANRQTSRETRTYVNPDPFFGGAYWGPRWGLYRHGYGWRYGYWGDPFWGPGPMEVDQVNRYEASAEILIGTGPKPTGAFDARSVIEHLGPSVQRPQGG